MKLLDDEFDKLDPLHFDQPELLHVNPEKWLKAINTYERKFNLGCYLFALQLFVGMMMLALFKVSWGLLLIILFSIFIKIVNVRKANNLKQHGRFTFEVHQDKIVRYSYSRYTIFKFADVKEARESAFGLILRKQKNILDYLWLSTYKTERKTQMVIPKSLYAFEQVRQFVLDRTVQR